MGKNTLSIVAILLFLTACSSSNQVRESNEQPPVSANSTDKLQEQYDISRESGREDYTECIETIVDSLDLRIYIPHYQRISYYTGQDIADLDRYENYLYLAAEAFTGIGYQNGFKHSLIAGDHVEDNHAYPYSSTRFHGYSCKRNTGAFVDYNGKYQFLYQDYSSELNMAAQHGGIGFAQEMMIHHSLKVPTTRPLTNNGQFRALCDRNNQLCIIESVGSVQFGSFISALLYLNVSEALYPDMGGWSFSWYRDKSGEVIYSFPDRRDLLTNAIVFMGGD